MIRYALQCDRGHAFESWFQNSSAYETQVKRKLVNCPACGSADVEKAIMAPQIVGKKTPVAEKPPAASTDVATPGSTPLLMSEERELRAKLKELRDHIVKTADNVGERFPNEARKMHYGDIEHRPIYGEASSDEARALIEEGRNHLLLGGSIDVGCPVRILQGAKDPDVPWKHAFALAHRLPADDVVLTVIQDGDHRLSRPQDIARIIAAVEEIG